MDESERMVALKKDYAEIILNTAKEAAARVIASEHRALRSQHDLNAAKGEALQLLLRLKKMIDAKETEAEINAINQRKRIEELEAQLQEAEDKILDLRVELRNVSDEVEKKKNEMQRFSGENTKEDAVYPKDEMPEEHLNNVVPIVPYSSDSEVESIAASSVTNRAFSQRIQDQNCVDATKQTGQLAASPQNYFGHSSDLASMIMRSTEPELYKNGCTQRIRAFERQHRDVSAAGEVVDGCISAMHELKSKASKKDARTSSLTFHRASSLATRKELLREEIKKPKQQARRTRKFQFVRSNCTSRRSYSRQLMRCSQSSSFVANCNLTNGNTKADEAIPAELSSMDTKEDMLEDPAGLKEGLHNNSSPLAKGKVLKGKRKRKVVRRKSLATSFRSVTGNYRTSLVGANVNRATDCCNVGQDEAEMESLQCVEPLFLFSKRTEDSARKEVHMSTIVKEQKLLNESQLLEQESDAAEVPVIPICNIDPEIIVGPVRSLKDEDVADDSKEPTKAKESRLLKYTFHRKRKKDSLNSLDDGPSPEKGNQKKLAMDTEDAAQESERSSVVNGSSRDSRRLAQVARQLISLSGKRW
ncbi:uncharacterized protein LOC116214729 isoform X1 [Punica granatum]|uniref:Uncharacterized protein LOC116214729 isoform X1 n=1 Tax=Punica granatum TaxID=22663 RepID=A0A6P8EHU1_PUNGR|nr:uncharacterized protein LOC116214729 isoform X1 [Punica granatum]